jgi:iron complex outermembrane receptor protein
MKKSGIAQIFVLVFCLCASLELSAQVKIRVQDSDGKAIYADTLLAYSSFGTLIKTSVVANDIEVYGALRKLHLSASGYQSLDTLFANEIGSGSVIMLTLRPENYNPMDEVVVSTGKLPTKVSRSSVSLTLLKPYLIENKVTADISNILEQLPGVNVTDGQINIRSGSGWSYGTGSRVMVTLDELPMLSPDAGAVQFSFLPIENLAGVEVVKSAGSVLYGSSALNGIINLRTAEPTSRATAKVNTFAGIYDFPDRSTLRWNSNRRAVLGNSGFWSQKTGRTSITMQWNGLYDQGYRLNEFSNRARMALRVKNESAKISGLSYGLNTAVQKGRSGSFLVWENFNLGYTTLDSSFNFTNSLRLNIDPFAEYKKGNTTHKFLGRFLAIENAVESDNSGSDQSNGSSMAYTEYRIVHRLPGIILTGGVVNMLAETHSPLFGGNQKARNTAAFVQADYQKNRLTLNAGARYEHFSINNFSQSKPVFRAGVNYAATRYTFIRASTGQGFRFPSMAEMFVTTSVGDVSVFANPGLRPETGWNAELGVKQGYKIGKFRGFADVSIFRTELQNMMEFSFGQWGPSPDKDFGFKSLNTAGCRIDGFEIETAGDGRIGQTYWQLLAGYTHTLPTSLNEGMIYGKDSANNNLSFLSTRSDSINFLKYRSRSLVRFDIQCRWKKLETGLSVRYNSPIKNIDVAFEQGILPLIIPGVVESRARIASAVVFDVRMALNFNKQWKFNLQITNLFNREYMGRPADIRPPRAFQLQAVWSLP